MTEKFQIESRICLALKMKNDRSWLLGMHQCDHKRRWTAVEQNLFTYAGQRLSDAYDRQSLLKTLKNNIAKRQKAEIDLAGSEKRFRSFFENSSVSLWLIDFSGLRKRFRELKASGVTDLNKYFIDHQDAFLKMSGLIRLVDVNQATVELFEAENKEQVLKEVNRLFTRNTNTVRSQFFLSVFSGSVHFSRLAKYTTFKKKSLETVTHIDILSGNDSFALVSITDISQQRTLEKTLAESREQYKALIETANDAILVADADTGLIIQANEKAEELTGYKKSELIGLHQRVLSSSGEEGGRVGEVLLQVGRVSDSGADNIVEMNLVCADGVSIPVEVSTSRAKIGGRILIQGILRDLRERQACDEHLKLLATVTEQTDDAVVITNTQGQISYVNPAFERISGYRLAEVFGKNPNLLKSGRHDDAFYKIMWDTLKDGEVWHGNLINRTKNGSFYEEDAIITPVKDHTGKIKNYVAVKRDKTRQIALEKQVRESRKMLAISTLAGGIAHDFNNILTAIMGYAELAQYQCEKNTPLARNLGEIVRGADRAGRLIEHIRTFSRQTEKNVAALSLSMVVQQAFKRIRANLPDSINLVEKIDTGLMVRADPTQLHQVIMNLCDNACQAMKHGHGTLTVTVGSVSIGIREGVRIGNLSAGNYVCISIQDTGVGLSAEHLRRVFEPYFTTHEQCEGTGLGLSVVHGIVNDHRGAITVKSEIGKGSCFTVYLPEIPGDENNVVAQNQELMKGSGLVMVVDDEQQIVEYELQILKQAGYEVRGVSKSSEALKIIQNGIDHYDLIVTDMAMPGFTGLQLFREVRKKCPAIPVLLCTGYSEYVSKESSKKMGINGYLVKPFTAEQFAYEVKRVIEGSEEEELAHLFFR